jgi:tRNA/rRNA methyltransferase
MARFKVVLVNPQHDGNIGAVARALGNFNFDDLVLVNPCPLTDEAYKRAKHAGDILNHAMVTKDLSQALSDCSLVVGTTGIITHGPKHYLRIPITPRELAERTKDHEGKIALLFGREDLGLSQEELKRCDILVHIPSSSQYPVLNLSHAVIILLYELFQVRHKQGHPQPATEEERELLYQFFRELLDAIDYPDFRKENTEIMFRRMMGRAVPTKYEFYTIMGVIGDAAKTIKKEKRED